MIDYWQMIFFNLFFTSLPPIVFGILDKDVSAETLLALPELYKSGQNSEVRSCSKNGGSFRLSLSSDSPPAGQREYPAGSWELATVLSVCGFCFVFVDYQRIKPNQVLTKKTEEKAMQQPKKAS